MQEIFLPKGVLHKIGGNQPVLLQDRNRVWMVQAGRADIFAVFLENGNPVGLRSHLFRAEQGDYLFGYSHPQYPNEAILVSGLTGTELIEIDTTAFTAALQYHGQHDQHHDRGIQFDQCARNWIGGLYQGVRTCSSIPPKINVHMKPGHSVQLKKEQSISPAQNMVWIRVEYGSLNVLGKEESSVISGDIFPLSRGSWLTATEDSSIISIDTDDYLEEDPDLNGFYRFIEIILKMVHLNRLNQDAFEAERLKQKLDNEASAYDLGLKNLASVMEPSKKSMVTVDEDPLFRACVLVGHEMGIIFKPLHRETSGTKDKLDTITRFSSIRKRDVALKGDWWRRDNGPMLAFTEEDQKPMALIPDSATSYHCIDPDSGRSRRVDSDVAQELKPFATIFYRSFPPKALKGIDLFRFAIFKKYSELFTLLIMGLMGALLGLITPMAIGMIFDTIIPEASRFQMFQFGYILFTCVMATSIFEMTRGFAALRLEGKIDAALQCAVMDRLLLLSPTFFRRFTAGDLAERTLGINAIRQVLSSVVITTALSSIFSLFYFVLLFWYSWKLALVAIGLTFLSVTTTVTIAYMQVRNQRYLATIQGKISGMILQFITGISKLKITGTENRAFVRWSEQFANQERISYKAGILTNFISTFNIGFPVLATMAIFFSVVFMTTGDFSTGKFLAFNSAYGNFQNALLQMSMTVITVMGIVPLYERAKPILESIPEVDTDTLHPGELRGDIEINHINFRYTIDGPLVLDGVSMQIKAGEFVAIVGSSGSGKSTLFRLLVGFETQEAGSIYYDGQDLNTIDVREVRRQIGVVLQNSKIMPGDIFKNIIGSSSYLTIEDAWEAARLAGLEQDIKDMPMGMHTMLQAGGGTLSGGQKQRLMIARAIVHKPRIIYFDEATSALDNHTQSIVIKSLEDLQATRVMIAHRLSTIVNADRIFVLEKGCVVQIGSYEELIRQPGIFADLAKRQIA